MKPVHKVIQVTPVPWIFEYPSATNHGVQILVLSKVNVLVGGQIHHGQLRVINEKATDREQNEGNQSSGRNGQPGEGAVLRAITENVGYQRHGKGQYSKCY